MKKAEGMTNAQNIPATETDFDDRPRNEEERIRRKDNQQIQPPDKQPSPTVEEPPGQHNSINENPREPNRVMKERTSDKGRIF